MKWHDVADVVKQAHPGSAPIRGACYRSEDALWQVSRVDTRDESKGWAIWFMPGQRRLCERVHLSRASEGMALVEVLALPVRGVALLLRMRDRARAVFTAARILARR